MRLFRSSSSSRRLRERAGAAFFARAQALVPQLDERRKPRLQRLKPEPIGVVLDEPATLNRFTRFSTTVRASHGGFGGRGLLRYRQPDLEREPVSLVVPALTAAGLAGGAYIGVGPDQNFSYIAAIAAGRSPFIVDIRRDNLLLHLLFKAIFARPGTGSSF